MVFCAVMPWGWPTWPVELLCFLLRLGRLDDQGSEAKNINITTIYIHIHWLAFVTNFLTVITTVADLPMASNRSPTARPGWLCVRCPDCIPHPSPRPPQNMSPSFSPFTPPLFPSTILTSLTSFNAGESNNNSPLHVQQPPSHVPLLAAVFPTHPPSRPLTSPPRSLSPTTRSLEPRYASFIITVLLRHQHHSLSSMSLLVPCIGAPPPTASLSHLLIFYFIELFHTLFYFAIIRPLRIIVWRPERCAPLRSSQREKKKTARLLPSKPTLEQWWNRLVVEW